MRHCQRRRIAPVGLDVTAWSHWHHRGRNDLGATVERQARFGEIASNPQKLAFEASTIEVDWSAPLGVDGMNGLD